mmetsp:Transcript_81875/g.232086  ORF Transcript_81875/g.232086 Transcript_81875/m.232086 type:complete len:213 (+) Transcript_81875:412-1050(+)
MIGCLGRYMKAPSKKLLDTRLLNLRPALLEHHMGGLVFWVFLHTMFQILPCKLVFALLQVRRSTPVKRFLVGWVILQDACAGGDRGGCVPQLQVAHGLVRLREPPQRAHLAEQAGVLYVLLVLQDLLYHLVPVERRGVALRAEVLQRALPARLGVAEAVLRRHLAGVPLPLEPEERDHHVDRRVLAQLRGGRELRRARQQPQGVEHEGGGVV